MNDGIVPTSFGSLGFKLSFINHKQLKQVLRISVFALLTGVVIFISCKKEYSCENCRETNKAPIANAGKDTAIILPVDSVTLDGRASSDPDGSISSYQWIKISGPASFNNY